ncbi:Mitochondrial protein [Trichinella spiralis]|uniref:Mitochondrial protein n=1 Tax=Trichinella spiralis TaxID=6334 RepID=A0ABR3KMY6_TRISP
MAVWKVTVENLTTSFVVHFEHFMNRGIYAKQYVAWSLEATAKLLSNKFPNSFIIIIRASDEMTVVILPWTTWPHCLML